MSIELTAHSHAASRPRRFRVGSSWLNLTIAFALALGVALVGTETWQMWHVREATLRSAKIVTANLANSISSQIDTTLKTADTVVGTLAQRVEAEGVTPESLQRLYGLMTSLASALPAIHEMGLTDKDGNAIVKSLVPHPTGMNYAERDYFKFLKAHNTRDVFIGQPVRSKVDNTLNVTVSRRVNDRNGNFAGVVVSSVSMEFFRKMFERVQLRSSRFIALLADDGTVLAASPVAFGDGELAALAAAPAGADEYVSSKDDVTRVGSLTHLAQYPMTVIVTEDSAAILGEWSNQLHLHTVIVFCVLIVIGVLGYRVNRASRATRLQALRDGLTGLANRGHFNDTIEREFRRAQRHGQPLSLIMLDIDHFKHYNDRYGHPAGDACLRAVSAAVQGALRRPSDMAARYGGEEIAILLPATDTLGAVQIMQNVREAVRGLAIRHDASEHGMVTLSGGVASWQPGSPIAAAGALIEAADTALYESKAAGRNTVTVDARSAAPAPRVVVDNAA